VASVVYAALAVEQIERAAPEALSAIDSALRALASHPLLGARVEGELRALVISHGRSGYVALYRFVVPRDEVRVLALARQRELGFVA
jgi:plasmid stabilization system protein ParE